jgi:trigger factor
MEVVKNQIDDLNATLTVSISNSDVAENVEKSLREYRRKAVMPGFRPGNIPMGIIKKMYRKAVMADELNKLVSSSISDYLADEKINIIAEPLPSEDQEQIDFEKQDLFNFSFDIALIPEFELKLSKRDKVTKYSIKVDNEMIEKYISDFQGLSGSFIDIQKSNEEALLNVNLAQLDEAGNILEDGIKAEDVSISIKMVKDEEIHKSFLDLSVGSIVDFDIKKAYPNDAEISSILKINKEEIENLQPNFRMYVNSIREFKNAEINQDLFDKCFGKDVIKTEEEFRNRVVEDIKASFSRETKYKFLLDVKEKLLKKADFNLPEEFLKRWLIVTNKDITDEQIKSEFPIFIEGLRWDLIKSKIAKENEIKIEHEEMLNIRKQQLMAQFSQYGIKSVPDEYLTKYAQEIFQKKDEANKIYEMAVEEKVVDFVAGIIKTEETEVDIKEFEELFK